MIMHINVSSLCMHQGTGSTVAELEKRMVKLKAENKPFDIILKQTITALCAEEVGYCWRT